MHGLLAEEAAQILALFDEWGETDRSHRKLAHRGSYLGRVWVSPASVRRVLHLADKHFRPLPRPGRSVRRPFPEWADYVPNSIWIYDTTHFTACGMAVLVIEDLVSRKWLTEVVSVEETSTQVELAFTQALDAEGLLELIEVRHHDGRVDLGVEDQSRPILLAVSYNGPQMISGSTREFMALHAIARHFGRPGTPTDQAWIESFNGHLKREHPHLLAIRDPQTLRAELATIRAHYNNGCTPASATSRPTTNTKDEVRPSARPVKQDSNSPDSAGLPGTASTGKINPTRTPTMLANQPRSSDVKSDTRHGKAPTARPEQARRAGQAVARDGRAGRPTRRAPVRPTRDELEVRLRLPVAARMPRGTKIHLFAALPQPFTDGACRHSAVVVRSPRPAATQGRGPTRTIAATLNQSRRDERRL